MVNIKLIVLISILAWLSYMSIQNWFSGAPTPKFKPQWWGPKVSPEKQEDTSIQPFKIHVAEDILVDLKHRLDNTRFSSPPLEGINFQYGFNSETLKKIVDHWRNKYNWREREAYINRYPHFKTRIQGLEIHFVHVKPNKYVGTIPLLLLHGWPCSFREFYPLIELLEKDGLGLEIIVPSLPGYAWSSAAAKPGLGPPQMAVLLTGLMERLGFNAWYVHGVDWGSQIGSYMAVLYPQKILGLHITMCFAGLMKTAALIALISPWPSLFMEPRFVQRNYPMAKYYKELALIEGGYFHLQATKPNTIGAGLADSPAGLAAYMLEKFSTGTNLTYRDLPDGALTEKYTYDDLLDQVMIYWLTNSMTTSMTVYLEYLHALSMENTQVKVKTWCARFPNEIVYLPDWILKYRYPELEGSTDMERGGHFAAMEEPKLLADDILRALRHFDPKLQDRKESESPVNINIR